MIYTLTISPSLDYTIKIDNLELGKINRTHESTYLPGGKGINVSQVLKQFGIESTVLGFISGFTGDYLEELLKEQHIKTDFIRVDGLTRINVKIQSKDETAINTDSLKITAEHIEMLKEKLRKLVKGDVLVISGNITRDLPITFYGDLIKEIDKEVIVIVDASGELLVNTLKYHPFIIKPNREELEEIFYHKIKRIPDCIQDMQKLQSMGARNVIVSLDKDGAILLDKQNNRLYIKSIEGKVLSTVGAGDSLVAGIVAGLVNNENIYDSFVKGVATGTATAFSYSLATIDEINETLEKTKELNKEELEIFYRREK